jgi:hydrogenase nickel incorporation protein HypA/HybF
MHEASLMADLLAKITTVTEAHHVKRVVGVHLKLGALSHVSPAHLREHFRRATRGTIAEGARLQIALCTETGAAHAQEVLLESIEVEE